jgi:hypothetical protein
LEKITTAKTSPMTKLHFIKLVANRGLYLSEKEIARIAILAFGISQSKSVNISKVNDRILGIESGCSSKESQYKNLLKPFQTGNYENLIKTSFQLIVLYFYGGEANVRLVLDRTNWDLGSEKINILTVGLLTKEDIFIPLVWKDLGYKGNSDSQIRIDLIDRILVWWSDLSIPVPTFEICGDREFIGEYWLTELSRRDINYVIRLRSDLSFETWLNGEYKVEKRYNVRILHRYLNMTHQSSIEVVLHNEAIARVFVVKNEGNDEKKEPYIYFITNIEDVKKAALFYRKRWKIEVFFKYLKSQGFDLEDFNMSGQHKTDILMSVLSIVFLMVIDTQEKPKSENQNIEQPTENNAVYKNGKSYTRKSTFRKGISAILEIRSFDNFMPKFIAVLEKIMSNWLFLKNICIIKNCVQ